ncbi:MAG: glycosyltransferase family 2 protein [Marmoricola sp.]
MRDVWVVVPVYNEEECVGDVVRSLRSRFDNVLCVDDGSTDRSAAEATAAGARVLSHAINLGQGAALQTGFDYIRRYTDAEFCVTFDADGQHVPEDAQRMVDELRESGADIALASRFSGATSGMPRRRAWILRAGTWFTRVTARLEVTDTHNGLRVLRRTAIERIRLHLNGMAYASELLGAIVPHGLSYIEVPTTVLYTEYSRSKGQRNINAVNILFDLAAERLGPAR